MISKQIIQFKCVVSLCDQDFGAFCRERGPGKKKRFGQQPGATKQPAEDVLAVLVEVGSVIGMVDWRSWVAGAIMEVGGWLAELRSLLGWLWWHWVFWCGGPAQPTAPAAQGPKTRGGGGSSQTCISPANYKRGK